MDPDAGPGASEVKLRAASGAIFVGLRGIGIRLIGLIGNVVLARLLVPADFGLIAFGTAVTTFATVLADSGLGAGLVRREVAPTRAELRSIVGFQLIASLVFVLCVTAIALPLGRPGIVAAIMVSSLLFSAFSTPGTLLYERELRYRPLVTVELAQTLSFNAFAIITVALGAGVWGMAAATVVQEIVGGALLIVISTAGFVLPSFRLAPVRALLAFGVQFQAVGFLLIAGALGLSAGIGAFGGLAVLGLWSVASRFLSIASLVMESLWRVSFPMLSRLIDAGEDVRGLIARNVALVTFAIGLMASALVGAGPSLVTTIVGHRYAAAASVLPTASLALVLSVPVGAVVGGYLFAKGQANRVLIPMAITTGVNYAVTFPLVHYAGVWGVGIGALVSGAVGCILMLRATDDLDIADIARQSWPPVVASIIAGGCGLAGSALAGHGFAGIVAGAGVAAAAFLAVTGICAPSLVTRVLDLLRRALLEAFGRGRPTAGLV
jgi:O-antigen/teichoic acid export membrane protein